MCYFTVVKFQIRSNKKKITALHRFAPTRFGLTADIYTSPVHICGVYTRSSTVRNARSRLALRFVSLNKVFTTYLVCLIYCECVLCACEFDLIFQSHDRGQWNSKSDQKHASLFRPNTIRLHCLPYCITKIL